LVDAVGFTYVEVVVHGRRASRPVRMLVDASSTYIVMAPALIKELGLVETPYQVDLTLADGRRISVRLFLAEVEVLGRRGPAFVAELETPTPLLGIYALEAPGLKVNPLTGELETVSPEGGFLLASLAAGCSG